MTSWTKEPPKEPGWYWMRYDNNRGGPWIIQRDIYDRDTWWLHGSDCESYSWEIVKEHGEWWPIPITPPSEEAR